MTVKHIDNSRTTPQVTCDIIIEVLDWEPTYPSDIEKQKRHGLPGIVLIERGNAPLGYALPGGFVDVGERAIDAAVREALEETTLHVTNIKQFHAYTSPGRDPRGHAITIVYIAQAIGVPKGEDDAKTAFVADPMSLANIADELCFNHGQIITDYINFRQHGVRPVTE